MLGLQVEFGMGSSKLLQYRNHASEVAQHCHGNRDCIHDTLGMLCQSLVRHYGHYVILIFQCEVELFSDVWMLCEQSTKRDIFSGLNRASEEGIVCVIVLVHNCLHQSKIRNHRPGQS